MPGTQTLEITELIGAPVEQVYRSFTSSVAMESWFSDFADLVPSENGRFYVFWNAGHYAAGLFKELVENQRIRMSWRGQGESKETDVEVRFEGEGDKTRVMILHSGLGTTGHWEESCKAIKSGWVYALDNLRSVFETGLDKRVYDRPLLGIYPNQPVDEDLVNKLNLPISTGVQISGVVDGLGAEAAGLQADDVIISLNGHELKAFTDFASAIGGVKAGEIVEVVFYRGDRKHTIDMELSHRPLPEVSNSAADLAKKVAETYEEVNAEIDQVFEGVTDEEASFRPGPKDWSAKETLVHLLYSERWLHLAISCAVADQRAGGFVNQLELIKAMADCYSSSDLIAELKKCEEISVKSLEVLPADFVADKRKYIGFACSFGQGFALHSHSHLPQIQAAIEAARKG